VTIPSRSAAAGILLDLAAPPTLVRHMTAVAEIAAFLAERVAARGATVDRTLVESAALLHDLDKGLPETDPLRRLGHGHAGAAWLREQDHGELAPAVDSHPVMRLTTPDAERWLQRSSLEERIVAYADKRAAQRLGPIDARFKRWFDNHPEHTDGLRLARDRAAELERAICDAADVDPTDVRRLRWVSDALGVAAADVTRPRTGPATQKAHP
jgi:putative nucleotidyltransferase with HDIG domain